MTPSRKFIEPNSISSPDAQNIDPRHLARQLALQFLYQLDMQDGANLDQMQGFLTEHTDQPPVRQMAEKWIIGVWNMRGALDESIGRICQNWDLSRITQVDRSNLRLAVYQLTQCPEVPHKVVINEAVELAKIFSTAQAPAFVNGVLDALRKNLPSKTE
jgi:N utilization substance protein B